MKKLLLTALFMLGCRAVYSLPVGNPAEASLYKNSLFTCGRYTDPCNPSLCWKDAWSVRLGFYGDYVFNRNLSLDEEGFSQGEVIHRTELYTNAAYFVFNIADKLDIYGTYGESSLTITTGEASWISSGNSEGRLEWSTAASWSAGLRGTLFQWGYLKWGVEGQYFQMCPDLSTYVAFSDGGYTSPKGGDNMKYQEWQVGMGPSCCFTSCGSSITWNPYAAIKCGWVRFDVNDFSFEKQNLLDPDEFFTLQLFNMKANKLWGYALGLTVELTEMVGVTVEGRWADEKAIYVNGQFRF